MDTLNTTVIDAHTTLSLSSYHRWNALSPSLMSENNNDNNEVFVFVLILIELAAFRCNFFYGEKFFFLSSNKHSLV